MAIVFEEYTTEAFCCTFVFFVAKRDSMQRIYINKYFLFTLGSVCHIKRFKLGGTCFVDDEDVETEVRK
jgi:hypothetical protein